jgi:hypothetical protein
MVAASSKPTDDGPEATVTSPAEPVIDEPPVSHEPASYEPPPVPAPAASTPPMTVGLGDEGHSAPPPPSSPPPGVRF